MKSTFWIRVTNDDLGETRFQPVQAVDRKHALDIFCQRRWFQELLSEEIPVLVECRETDECPW